jgi:uncharacterized iron-regulated membrane protein
MAVKKKLPAPHMFKKKTWFRIHSFTGVITGLLLFVICWSGTFAVISHELDWLVTPEVRSNNSVPDGQVLNWQKVYEAVVAAYPEGKVQWMEKPLYHHSTAQVVINLPDQDYVRIYVDPISFDLLGSYSYLNVQRFFRNFHMNLFLPYEIGSYIVMFFAITLLLSAIAALYFYSRWWRRFFRFNETAGSVWSELHKLAGLWSLWFILVIAITGCWYLFELMRSHIGDGKIVYTGSGEYAVHQLPKPTSHSSSPLLSVNELVSKAKSVRPDMDFTTIGFDWGDDQQGPSFYVDGQSHHWLVRNRANQVTLDSRTGEVLYNQNASDYPVYWRWSDTADPLHFGDFGGLISKIIWFIFGLFLSGIVLTGTWLHARRLVREKEGRRRNHWPGTVPAVIASLAVVGASFPFGIQSTREYYGVQVAGVGVLPELATGVSLVILLWTASTLAIIVLWCLWLFRTGGK